MGAGSDHCRRLVEEKVLPEYHDVVAMIRQLMRECAPDAAEKISYGMPLWEGNEPLAWITASKTGISFGFMQGMTFDDPYGLLKGRGKWARNVKLRKPADANIEALRHYIMQALERDAGYS